MLLASGCPFWMWCLFFTLPPGASARFYHLQRHEPTPSIPAERRQNAGAEETGTFPPELGLPPAEERRSELAT